MSRKTWIREKIEVIRDNYRNDITGSRWNGCNRDLDRICQKYESVTKSLVLVAISTIKL